MKVACGVALIFATCRRCALALMMGVSESFFVFLFSWPLIRPVAPFTAAAVPFDVRWQSHKTATNGQYGVNLI